MKQDFKEIAHNITFHPKKRLELFEKAPQEDKGQILLALSPKTRESLITKLKREELIGILELLDPDEVTLVIRPFSKKKQDAIVQDLTENIRERVATLLKFDPDTAGGLMSLDYIQVDSKDSMLDVIKQFKTHEKRTGKLPLVVVMSGSKIEGHIPGHLLALADTKDKAKKYTHGIQTIKPEASHKEVISLFREHPHNRLIVLGEEGNVIGAIYSDDVLRVLHEREAKSLYEFAGVSNQEQVFDSALIKVRFRYKWLIINLGTSFLAALTVGLFDETISKYVLLAVYMPIIAGMGGNAATQTLAVLVRGISLGQIKLQNAWRAIRNEVASGLANGLINGVLVGGVIILLNGDYKLAMVLGVSMVLSLMIAGFFGTIVPLIMQKLGKDPASSATIFITTATDVLGFLIFLGLATLFLV